MRQDAEAHAEEDKRARELAELRNNADNLAYQSEKQLNELGEKLSAEQKQTVQDAIKEVREALKAEDVDAIKRATETLQTRFQAISAELYKQAQTTANQPSGDAASSAEPKKEGKPGDHVVDADFEVVDEDKKKS
jgi:molecular chaperone DnaK